MDIGTPLVATRRRSVLGDGPDEHRDELVDAAGDTRSPESESTDTQAVSQ